MDRRCGTGDPTRQDRQTRHEQLTDDTATTVLGSSKQDELHLGLGGVGDERSGCDDDAVAELARRSRVRSRTSTVNSGCGRRHPRSAVVVDPDRLDESGAEV
jgi:hypothetical protein